MKDVQMRTGGRILVDQLLIHGATHAFCVPGESYLAVLDALHEGEIEITVCRQEGGAAMMAEAYGKLTGRPGICFVTRGPGATNAGPGIHIAMQDSTPMILFVGQVERGMRGREAFQELDYAAVFGSMAKWAVEVDDAARLPEIVSRAYHVATSGRPGPVVVALPEDMLTDTVLAQDGRRYRAPTPAPSSADIAAAVEMLRKAERPLVIAGGSRWSADAVNDLVRFGEGHGLPVAVSFRRQSLFPNDHPNYAGDLGVGSNPDLVAYARTADAILLLGGRLSELPSQGYELLAIPVPAQKLIHVHPDACELGRVYSADLGINVAPAEFLAALPAGDPETARARTDLLAKRHEAWKAWTTPRSDGQWQLDMAEVVTTIAQVLPSDTVVANGAGNYATWVHRFHRFTRYGTQLAPTSGSMGYGIPAAVAAARLNPERPVVAFAGDGCFLMNGQEFATAVQYDLPIIVIVADNGMYGTIRMHQERTYPGRVVATELKNPDFAGYARIFGGHGERVETSAAFRTALERAIASGKPAIIHCMIAPEALTIDNSLSAIRARALAAQAETEDR